jgi:hypothetical protein
MGLKPKRSPNRIVNFYMMLILFTIISPLNISIRQLEDTHPDSHSDRLISQANEANIWLVENLADSGPGSLREALEGVSEGDSIEFDATVFPPQTPGIIFVLSELPHITVDDLTINAIDRGVILDGSNLPDEITTGLILQADNSTIQGLQVQGFQNDGIVLNKATNSLIGGDFLAGEGNVVSGNGWRGIRLSGSNTANNVIAGNILGADPSGMHATPNGETGILVEAGAHHNTIGGTLPGYGNLISGNIQQGIVILGNGTDHNTIQGNLIGTDLTGDGLLGNGMGIHISEGPNNTLIGGDSLDARNIIAGNGGSGIDIAGIGTDDNLVQGNYIGVNRLGTASLPNYYGVFISDGAKRSIVGGDTPNLRNVISGNQSVGVLINGSFTSGSVVQGNYIGTDSSGTEAIPNLSHGIEIANSKDTLIGGVMPENGNLISSNLGAGIAVMGNSSTGNTVQGNYVGSDWTGEKALGNGRQGILLDVNAHNNEIGGELAGAGNLIRFNMEGGVKLAPQSLNNLLTGNRIADNQGIAIGYHPGNLLGVNTCSGNELNLVEVYADDLSGAGEVWQTQGELSRFVVINAERGFLTVPVGSSWGVGSGVEVLFDFGQQALINGQLEAQGTADQPIIFGSAQRYAAPLPGDWLGLSFEPGSSGNLEYTTVEFAQRGISIEGASVNIEDSIVTASQFDGISVGAASTLDLTNNTLAGNGGYGLNNLGQTSINAAGTWWGHESGPNGLGDRVNGIVNYAGWRTDPGFNDSWKYAAVLNPGAHSFPISSYQDLDWFRIPVGTRNATITATLTLLPRDYDLLLFSQLGTESGGINNIARSMTIGQATLIGDLDVAARAMTIARSMTIGQLAEAGDGFETGNLVAVSSQPETADEEISTGIWNQSGWYHLLVAGHNGANSPENYTLEITVKPGVPVLDYGFEPPSFEPPDFISPTIKTLILTNQTRLEENYGQAATSALMAKLDILAQDPEVAGQVISLDASEPISKTYSLWSENGTNPVHANLVAAAIQEMVSVNRVAYPNLEYIVLVGNDEIIPFWRVPDEVPLAHEGGYNPYLIPTSPVGQALEEQYFLTDDYYGGFNPIPWRGRGLIFPELGIGRLVETPQEVMASIDAFLANPTLQPADCLVVGYDFMTDGAESMAEEWETGDLAVTRLINDDWVASDLSFLWLENKYDINAINAHFEHWQAIPAQVAGGVITSGDVAESGLLNATLNYSIGCHSGLNVPDEQASAHGLDFAQVILGQGGTWIANTGFGYGDADAVGYSELLMTLFSHNLAQGDYVGHALRKAKADYFNLTGPHSFSPYDEKVLAEATLYGLPMMRVEMPDSSSLENEDQTTYGWFSQPEISDGLVTRQVTFEPVYQTNIVEGPITGSYFSVGDETEVNEWQPIQPRTSLDISLDEQTPHGAFFEGGQYQIWENFDPVVTRIVTETTDLPLWSQEPEFNYPSTWQPSWWSMVNEVWTPEGIEQRLVVIPAEYRSTTENLGVERLFDVMTYTIYYSKTMDIIPPSIWRIAAYRQDMNGQVVVEVTDLNDVVRVGVSYTLGNGEWVTKDLARSTSNPNLWLGTIPTDEGIEWFVQALDGAGNVAINDNKSAYFTQLADRFWMPFITREP